MIQLTKFKLDWSLQNFVAVALVSTTLGFLLIVGIGFTVGKKHSDTTAPTTSSSTASNSPLTSYEWKTEEKASTKNDQTATKNGSSSNASSNASASNATSSNTSNNSTKPTTATGGSSGGTSSGGGSSGGATSGGGSSGGSGGGSSGGGTTPPPPPPTYCSGQTPCYGPSDLASHSSTSGACWGRNLSWVIDLQQFKPNHPGPSSVIATAQTCGQDVHNILAGSASSNSQTHRHNSSTINNTSSWAGAAKIGYYDANKP